jgi:hypothetical protein
VVLPLQICDLFLIHQGRSRKFANLHVSEHSECFSFFAAAAESQRRRNAGQTIQGSASGTAST